MADITPADRELAASYAVLPEMRDLIRAGKAEHHAEPAAAHREAHEAPLLARIAELEAEDALLRDALQTMLNSVPEHDEHCSIGPIYKCNCDIHPAYEQARAALKGQSDDQ